MDGRGSTRRKRLRHRTKRTRFTRREGCHFGVESLSPEELGGTFDVVLFLGVLYHSKSALLYLERCRSVCSARMIIETHVDALDYSRPAAVFYPGTTLGGDGSNYWGPNPAAVQAMLVEAGFSKSGGYRTVLVNQICVPRRRIEQMWATLDLGPSEATRTNVAALVHGLEYDREFVGDPRYHRIVRRPIAHP